MSLSKTLKDHLIFYHAEYEQYMFDGMSKKTENPLERRNQYQMKIDKILIQMKGGFPYRI